MASVLSDKHFHDETAAYAWVEARVWPEGPVCPQCQGSERISKMKGASTRIGAYKCYACRKPFTVKVGTVFEASHVTMTLWLQAMFLMTSSTLGVTLKTAWFMSHRIRLAMQTVGLPQMGGEGATVEIDETYFGKEDRVPYRVKGAAVKSALLTLVERGGAARSFHLDGTSAARLEPFIRANVDRKTAIMTDEGRWYTQVGKEFASHETVHHGRKEYVRGHVTTNTVEGFFGVFKMGMKGVYQHCSEKHLHRYLAEFDFRYSNRVKLGVNDAMRADTALRGIVGKRLTYQTIAN